MQTTKFLVVLGAAAALLAPLPAALAAPDSEAQAKLREAMRLKMEELNAQAAPAPAPVAPPAPAPQPKPVVVEEIKAKERPPTVVVPVPAEPAPVVTIPAPVQAPKANNYDARFSELPEEAEAAKNAQLLESLRAKVATDKANAPAPMVTTPAAPAKPAAAYTAPITANIEAPASPLSGSKQERLAELLRRYKADEVTPQDYHKQRAQIIAE